MATVATRLGSPATTRPAEWDVLLPSDGEPVPWQVWVRAKGPGYWLLRWATKAARALSRLERALGREVPDVVANPNGVEEAAAVWTEEEARDCCRILYRHYRGRVAVTYGPVVVGRVHPLTSVPAVGDKRFDPFKVFDFSATEAIKEQARLALVDVDELARLRALQERLGNLAERVRSAL